LTVSFESPTDLKRKIAAIAKAPRLADNLSSRSLAEKSGVTQANYQTFEDFRRGQLTNLPDIAISLNCIR
jgi:hypothetical protein